MDIQTYLGQQIEAYRNYGILLSQAQISLIRSATDIEFDAEELAYLADSEAAVNRELELQFKTLSDAEEARDEAVRLRKLAEIKEQELARLNQELELKNSKTEAQLQQEKELRAQQNKFGIQRQLSLMLGGLVLIGLVIPYMAQLFYTVDQNTANQTGNIVLLLVNGLMIVVGSLFSRRQDEEKDKSE